MAMGIVSDKDFEKERESLEKPIETIPVINGTVVPMNKGRGIGNVEVPDSLRKVIGETAVTDGREAALDLAHRFGISDSSTSAYANGATSTASYNRTPNISVINGAKERVTRRALSRLNSALSNITPAKLVDAKPRDLAGIAKDMAAVVKSMEPEPEKKSGDGEQKPQFIIYAPQYKKEENYEVVYAKES